MQLNNLDYTIAVLKGEAWTVRMIDGNPTRVLMPEKQWLATQHMKHNMREILERRLKPVAK